MNRILFSTQQSGYVLSIQDPRFEHARTVLRLKAGDWLEIGVVNGPLGRACVTEIDREGVHLSAEWGTEPPALAPLSLIIGLPRPQTAKKILHDATTLGVERLIFFESEKGDPGYARSTLWTEGSWREHCILGAEQACDSRIPEVVCVPSLEEAMQRMRLAQIEQGWVLDVYEGGGRLGELSPEREQALGLAIGPERGWSARERNLFRQHGWMLVHMGSRVLRVESAVTVAVGLMLARMGRL